MSRLPTVLEPSELRNLLAAAQASSPRDYALIVLMAYGGLQVAEAVALQWQDIHTDSLLVRTLRHTAATRLLRATGNLILVQRFLGHASVATTQVYTHLMIDDLAEGLARLD